MTQPEAIRAFVDPVTLAIHYRNTVRPGWYATVRRSWGDWFVHFYGTGHDFNQVFDNEAKARAAAHAYATGRSVLDAVACGRAS